MQQHKRTFEYLFQINIISRTHFGRIEQTLVRMPTLHMTKYYVYHIGLKCKDHYYKW